MNQSIDLERGKNFFQYLNELNNLSGKVNRDYRNYDSSWFVNDINNAYDCRTLDECTVEGAVLQIQRPEITSAEKRAPKPPSELSDWVAVDINNPKAKVGPVSSRQIKNEFGEPVQQRFNEDSDRVDSFYRWKADWDIWSEYLISKQKAEQLYKEFFELITLFDREGENLEIVYGTGILTWKHPDPQIGTIRTPLLTTKLELELDAVNGIVFAKPVEETFQFESEPFTGVRLPHTSKINELIETSQGIFEAEELEAFFEGFVHLLDAEGDYIKLSTEIRIENQPTVYNQSLFILRSKQARVLRDDLQQIIEGLEEGNVELSDSVRSILTGGVSNSEPSSNNNADQEASLKQNVLFFPLPSNEQQKEIVRRVSDGNGVTVQGPPGTGKTHTIANLVSHFLSTGKKVLITSQKENPLKVLKNKIPEEIRNLCVPVLGSGREAYREIETSTRLISEKLGELDPVKLKEEVNRDLQELHESKKREARLRNKLKDYARKEGSTIIYRDQKLNKAETAKKLSEVSLDYSWIRDHVDFEDDFPLSETEFHQLWDLKNELSQDQYLLAEQWLPHYNDGLMTVSDFNLFIEDGNRLAEGKEVGEAVIEKYQWPRDVLALQQLHDDVQKTADHLADIDLATHADLISDIRAGGVRKKRWEEWIDEIETSNLALADLYAELAKHDLRFPPYTIAEIQSHLTILEDAMQKGKKLGWLFFAGKGKPTKYLHEEAWLDDHPLKTLEDIRIYKKFIEYQQLRNNIRRVYNAPSEETGLPTIPEDTRRFPYVMDEHVKQFKKIFNAIMMSEQLKANEKLSQFDSKVFEIAERITNEILEPLKQAIVFAKYEAWLVKKDQMKAAMAKAFKKINAHPIVEGLLYAFDTKNTKQYDELISELGKLQAFQTKALELKSLFDQLLEKLPKTRSLMLHNVGRNEEFPKDYLQAFEYKKLQSWLDETKDMNTVVIRKRIDEEVHEQSSLIKRIVANSTWANVLEGITEREKNALSAWKSSIKRYGKGTGKHANRYLKAARENMKVAQSAIPVWIMPIYQVLENFPATNEKFDVIIFDESSQCDIFSTNVLLRGKKVIVVGDEEQISPQSIGIKQDSVQDLARKYLVEIPNAELLDGNTSLYELAEQTFPKGGKLMLREHFRCVPEIIQFSNDLSYGGEMIPLRLPLEHEKIEPPVLAVKVEDGYNSDSDKDINDPEAEKIAEDIAEMVKNSKYNDQTIGVISLQGQKQHKLLEIKIRNAIGDEEFIKRKIVCGSPYTLQGDERDIIFLSLVVAPNRRFRSLTMSSDKQRFNVAASRARNQMRLYHSVDLQDLSTDDLRFQLLSYCKNPQRVNEEVSNLEALCDSPFEVDVLRMIVAKGYKVRPQVQAGRYRIDFVIEGLRDRLAVECDGERWHGPDKYEEDMRRQESLERAGWEFWRVRGRDFYFDKQNALEPLWKKLKQKGIEPLFLSN